MARERRSSAMDRHRVELINNLEILADNLFSYLQEEGVINFGERQSFAQGTNREKLLKLVGREGVLKFKDNGWGTLIKFLYANQLGEIAGRLQQSADEIVQNPTHN